MHTPARKTKAGTEGNSDAAMTASEQSKGTISSRPQISAWRDILGAFAPNRVVSKTTIRLIVVVQVGILLLVWATSSYPFLPKPMAVLSAFTDLWNHEGLGQELVTSFTLNLQAMAWTTVISLGLAYLTVVPAFRLMLSWPSPREGSSVWSGSRSSLLSFCPAGTVSRWGCWYSASACFSSLA